MSRDELLIKLLVTSHLSVEERQSLGGAVTQQELAPRVLKLLREHGHFPPAARPWTAGQVCFEGWQLLSLPSATRLLTQRSDPLRPHLLAESKFEDFDSDEPAADEYVRRAIGTSYDGIAVR